MRPKNHDEQGGGGIEQFGVSLIAVLYDREQISAGRPDGGGTVYA